jgi:CHAD domain-containing protein
MAARLRSDEAATRGLRRVARRDMASAARALSRPPPLADRAVHDTRKRLKEARAALRLLRRALGGPVYRRTNLELRDAARPLSVVRDAQARVMSFGTLTRRLDGRVDPGALEAARDALAHDRQTARRAVVGDESILRLARQAIDSARDRLRETSLPRRDWSVLGRGLRRVYRAARESFDEARRSPTSARLHEWRKRTKYLRHGLDFLRSTRSGEVRRLEERAHQLTDLLGDDRDLALLQRRLGSGSDIPPAAVRALRPRIRERRAELRRKALALGRRLFDPKPKRFARALRGRWRSWHRG